MTMKTWQLKTYVMQQEQKKAGVAILISDKTDLKIKKI